MAKKLPPRKKNAITGSQFMELMEERGITATDPTYEKAVIDQIMAGNVPSYMRPENWRKMTFKGKTKKGADVSVTIRVCPDYVAIGSDEDYVRVPLSAVALQRLSAMMDVALPTIKVADAIDKKAQKIRLVTDTEIERKKGKKKDSAHSTHMIKPDFILWQSKIADENFHKANIPKFKTKGGGIEYTLVSGHKKDVLVYDSPDPTRLVQYRPPEQGLDYGAHPNTHIDYSLGGRLIDQEVELSFKPSVQAVVHTRYEDIISHPEYYKLLSDQRFDIKRCYTIPRKTVPRKKTVEAPLPKKKPRLAVR